jgi:hypothetical protein
MGPVVDICASLEQQCKFPWITPAEAQGHNRMLGSESRALLMNTRALFEKKAHQINTGIRTFDGVTQRRIPAIVIRIDTGLPAGRTSPQKFAHAFELAALDQMMKFEGCRHGR